MMMKHPWRAVAVLALVGASWQWAAGQATRPASKAGGDWCAWRGPNHDGISPESDWSAQWPAGGPTKLWTANVDVGFSAAAVCQGKVYCSGNKGNADTIYCYKVQDGSKVWSFSYPCPTGGGGEWPGTRSTPVIDGGLCYVISRKGDFFCLDAEGKPKWQKDLRQELGVRPPQWGFAGSALIQGEQVIVNVGVVAAYDKKSGKLEWKSENFPAGYSTPVPFEWKGGKYLACFQATPKGSKVGGLVILQASDGKTVWNYPWETDYDVNACDPIIHEDKIFITSGYKAGCALLQMGAKEPKVIYRNKVLGSQFSSPVLYKGNLYGFDGNTGGASFKCINFATGEVKWTGPRCGMGSLMLAGDKLLAMIDGGELAVVEANPEKHVELAKAKVTDKRCWTMPVLADGRVYCRGNEKGELVCLDVRAGR